MYRFVAFGPRSIEEFWYDLERTARQNVWIHTKYPSGYFHSLLGRNTVLSRALHEISIAAAASLDPFGPGGPVLNYEPTASENPAVPAIKIPLGRFRKYRFAFKAG
jgi:hypothetical protein